MSSQGFTAFEEFGIAYRQDGSTHCTTGWVQIDCPFCGKGTEKWHMGYSVERRLFNCWRCGPHRMTEVAKLLVGEQAKALMKALLGTSDGRYQKSKVGKRHACIIPTGVGPLKNAHKSYLLRRGFAPAAIASLYGVRGIGLSATLSWRLFIPIHFDGRIVSWTARSLSNNATRYINATTSDEEISAKSLLYGEEYARESIVIVEGPTDAWRGGPGFVATMGLGYSAAQLLRMSKYPRRTICFDNEPAAQQRANRLAEELCLFPGETHIAVVDSEDVGSASRLQIAQLRQACGLKRRSTSLA